MKIRRGMKEAFAVTGYVKNEIARKLDSGKFDAEHLDVRVESKSDLVVMRVKKTDISEARLGASAKGEVLVQIILVDNAHVQTIINHDASVKGLRRFNDPVVQRLTALATVKSISV